MSRLSDTDADTLRSWFEFTVAVHGIDKGVPRPHMPVGMMLLVWLSIHPDGTATLTELRDACKLDDTSKVSHAAKPLIGGGFVASVRRARETELRITTNGRNVVSHYFHAAFPKKKG